MGAGRWDGKESSRPGKYELDVSNFNRKPLKGPVLGRDQIYLKKKKINPDYCEECTGGKRGWGLIKKLFW